MRLSGPTAITYAAIAGESICNYTTPIEDASDNVSIDDANELCRSDAGLVYVDTTEAGDSCLAAFGLHEAHDRLASFGHSQDVDDVEAVLDAARERNELAEGEQGTK